MISDEGEMLDPTICLALSASPEIEEPSQCPSTRNGSILYLMAIDIGTNHIISFPSHGFDIAGGVHLASAIRRHGANWASKHDHGCMYCIFMGKAFVIITMESPIEDCWWWILFLGIL